MKFFTKANIILIASLLVLPRILDMVMVALHYPDATAVLASCTLIFSIQWLLCYRVYKYVYLKRFLWRNIAFIMLLAMSVACIYAFACILFPNYVPVIWKRVN